MYFKTFFQNIYLHLLCIALTQGPNSTDRGSFLKTDRTIPLVLLGQNCPKFVLKPPAWNEELLAEATTRRSEEL